MSSQQTHHRMSGGHSQREWNGVYGAHTTHLALQYVLGQGLRVEILHPSRPTLLDVASQDPSNHGRNIAESHVVAPGNIPPLTRKVPKCFPKAPVRALQAFQPAQRPGAVNAMKCATCGRIIGEESKELQRKQRRRDTGQAGMLKRAGPRRSVPLIILAEREHQRGRAGEATSRVLMGKNPFSHSFAVFRSDQWGRWCWWCWAG